MSTYLKPILTRKALLEKGVKMFTPSEFGRLFGANNYQIKYFLEEQTKRGLLIRLKKGLYALRTDLPGEEEIANALYRPSYLSFEYALAFYGLLPESPYIITSATTKPTRLFTLEDINRSFAYYTIKKPAYGGYFLFKEESSSFLIAEPEKAVVDYLYLQSLGKKPPNERLTLRGLNQDKLLDYAKCFERKNLIKLVEGLK